VTVGADGIKSAKGVDTTGAVDATTLLAHLAAGDTTTVELAVLWSLCAGWKLPGPQEEPKRMNAGNGAYWSSKIGAQ
jgi:hypothetical protein